MTPKNLTLNTRVFEQLHAEGLISDRSLERVRETARLKLFSVFWELRTVLYVGVLLLTTGLGILIYKNIDTIGHQVILAFIALLCAGCFYYCERKKNPFSTQKVNAPNPYFDYILLLGCLTLIIFLTYLQVQYTVFGSKYGLATFIPMVILFFCAYYFDHLGVLTLAITNLAAWMGVVVTPMKVLTANNFQDGELIFAGLVLGVFLTVAGQFSVKKNWKSHFSFTYLNFGLNILYVATLAGMYYFDRFFLLWLFPLAALDFYFYRKATERSSFFFMLMMLAYNYVGISYVILRFISDPYLTMLYFIASSACTIVLFIHLNKKLKGHDGLSK